MWPAQGSAVQAARFRLRVSSLVPNEGSRKRQTDL